MPLAAPTLSEFDPIASGEGSIDPLGSLGAYERLANRIYPYVTARMSRVRFLTAIAAGAVVCESFDPDEVAADGRTPPWLVFEWYVTEAFVRCRDDFPSDDGSSFPGSQKVAATLKAWQKVSDATYLKTPKVFGFTGVYKSLAEGLQIVTDDLRLDEGAFELIRQWEREEGLGGFFEQRSGLGADVREQLRKAIVDGLRAGHASRPSTWGLWRTLAGAFHPGRGGKAERAALLRRLSDASLRRPAADPVACDMRRELVQHLVDDGAPVKREDEAEFFRALQKKASSELARRLDAIDTFEGVCRVAEDGFRLILHLSTAAGGGAITVKDFAGRSDAKRWARKVAAAARRAGDNEDLVSAEPSVRDLASRYGSIASAEEFFEALLDHHEKVQREKPPDPKRPWFERLPGGGVAARVRYQQPEAPAGRDIYVHDYRTAAVSSFLRDLGALPR